MMRQPPTPPVTHAATAADTRATPPVHPPLWHHQPSELFSSGGSSLGTVAFYLVLLVTLPVYALVLLAITLFEAAKGLPLTYAETLTDPLLLGPLFGTACLAACIFWWLGSEPWVHDFSFDETQQRLTYSETRPARKPRQVQVAFSDIYSITPYQMREYEKFGHYQVTYKGPKGKTIQRRLGTHIPLVEMEAHSAWLRGMIGKRMSELISLEL